MNVQDLITAAAARYRVDPVLALAVARRESGFNQAAVSAKGAIGVFQLMPGTAADLRVNPFNLIENVDGGVRYLSQMLRQFGGDTGKALAAYNWGPGNLATALTRWGTDWIGHAPTETRDYVFTILGWLTGSRSSGGDVPGAGPQNTLLLVAALALGAALLLSMTD